MQAQVQAQVEGGPKLLRAQGETFLALEESYL
jgi:hypothetical protein